MPLLSFDGRSIRNLVDENVAQTRSPSSAQGPLATFMFANEREIVLSLPEGQAATVDTVELMRDFGILAPWSPDVAAGRDFGILAPWSPDVAAGLCCAFVRVCVCSRCCSARVAPRSCRLC